MKTTLLYREAGPVIDTASRWGWLWQAGAICSMVGVLALATHLDDQARQRDADRARQQQAALGRAFDAGMSQGHADMLASARTAWQAARNDDAVRCARPGRSAP